MLLLQLQIVQVAILWMHDLAPLPPLNDVEAIRRQDTLGRLVWITLLQSVPFTIGLGASAAHVVGFSLPWLRNWLWISYLILFAGELRAWWWPYLVQPDPVRAKRYATMFGRTNAFLPVRNGIVPNTLHCVLHLATAATLVTLGAHPRSTWLIGAQAAKEWVGGILAAPVARRSGLGIRLGGSKPIKNGRVARPLRP